MSRNVFREMLQDAGILSRSDAGIERRVLYIHRDDFAQVKALCQKLEKDRRQCKPNNPLPANRES